MATSIETTKIFIHKWMATEYEEREAKESD